MAEPVKIKFEYENPNNIEAEVPGAQKLRDDVQNGNGQTQIQQKMKHLDDGKKKLSRKQNDNSNREDKNNEKKTTRIPVSKFKQTVERVKAQRRGSTDKKEHESQIPIRRSSIPKLVNKAPTKPIRKAITKIEATAPVVAPNDEFDKLYEEVVHSPTPIVIDESILDIKEEDSEKLEKKFEEIIHDYNENTSVDEKVKKTKIPFLKRRSHHDIDVGDKNSKIIAARNKLRKRHSSLKSNELNSEPVTAKTNGTTKSKARNVNIKEKETVRVDAVTNDAKHEEADQNIAADNEVDESTPNKIEVASHSITITGTTSKDEEEEPTKIEDTTTVTEINTNESSDKIENAKGFMIEENICKGYVKVGIPVFDSYVHEHTEESNTETIVEVKKELSYTTDNEDLELDKVEDHVEIIEISNEPIVTEIISNNESSLSDITDISNDKGEENQVSEIENDTEVSIEDSVNIGEANAERNFIEITEPIDEDHLTDNEKSTEQRSDTETVDIKEVMKEKDNNVNIAKLRGKLGKLISKLQSEEPSNEEPKKVDNNNDLPKNKSVMSKIAMFERHEAAPISKSKIPKRGIKLPKPLNTNTQPTETVHVHTPLVVDEVFKPFQADENLKISDNNVEITTNSDNEINEFVRAEMVFIESPEIIHYEVENKVQIESNTLFVQKSLVSEEVLTPVLRNFEPKNEETINVNGMAEKIEENTEDADTPVVIPKFKRVKEVLKKYESLKSHDEASVNNKIVEDLPKTRPIREIINAFKPETSHRFDSMFAHQATPINEILKNLNADVTEFTDNNNDINDHSNTDDVHKTKDKAELQSFKSIEYKTLKSIDDNFKSLQYIQNYHETKAKDDLKRAKSLAELDLGDAVKGKVNKMIIRMNSAEKIEVETKEVSINIKEKPRKRSVLEKIALFERKLTSANEACPVPVQKNTTQKPPEDITAVIQEKITELAQAKVKYGKMKNMPSIELANGVTMPILAVGTALLEPRLVFHIVSVAIELGYRAFDTAHIYGNEKLVGEAINAKINDGTVTRSELFIISKLWSTFHRTDLVKVACEASLEAMGLEYFDLYMIHNPMSFKEGGSPLPKIATVLQYSQSDYLDAWYGMETLGSRVRALGVSNFNSDQIRRLLEKAKVKPVVNQVECHPYLSQQRLSDFCSQRNITLSCFGVLGSKGTPIEMKSGYPAVIDDPLLKVMASGLNMSPAQLLIRYQIECGHGVVVKASTGAHLWDNLQAVTFNLTSAQVDALHALNRNKRTFTFKGMGDTHKNYPFNAAF